MAGAIKNIGAGITLDGEADFKKAVAEINKSIGVLGSEMRKVSAEFDNNADSMASAAAKSDVYKKQMDEQRKKIDVTRAALADAAREYGENSRQVKDWQIKLNNAEAQLKKTENALNKMNEELDDSGTEFNDAGQSALAFGDILRANIISDAVVGGFRMLGSAIKSAVGFLSDFASQGIETASDIAEVQNVVDVTFGSSADAIEEFAQAAAVSFGMSELSAKQFSGTMGAMLKSVGLAGDSVLDMSTAMTGLAGDMASFYNIDVETAFNKLRSGISGEIEPLKQLGINLSVANLEAYALSQGMTTAYSAMTEAEKVTLRYNYILGVTADAQGDFARTADSYANQQRILSLQIENLSAQIGEKLLPIVNELTTATNEMLSGAIGAEDFGQRIGQTLSSGIETIAAQLPEFVGAGGEIVASLIDGMTNAIPAITASIVAVAGDISAAFLSILPDMVNAGTQITTALLNGIATQLPELTPLMVDTLLQIVQTLTDNLPLIFDAGIAVIEGLGVGIIEAIPDLVGKLPQIVLGILEFVDQALPEIARAGVKLLSALWDNAWEIDANMRKALADLDTKMKEEFRKQYPSWVDVGAEIMSAIIDGMFTFVPFLRDFFEWIGGGGGDAPAHIGGSGKTFGGVADAKADAEVPVHDREAALIAEAAAVDAVDALAKLSEGTERVAGDLSDVIRQVSVAADDTSATLVKKILDKIEDNTREAALIAEATASTARILERSSTATWDKRTQTSIQPGQGYIDWGGGDITWIGKNAGGTDFWRGGLTWVGEQGPELVSLPRGSQIYPSEQSSQMGGGDIIINVDISKLKDVDDLIRIAKTARQSTRMGVV